jgi:SAM-dependent methyltransferase
VAEKRPAGLLPRLYEWECRQVLGRTVQDVGFWLQVARSAPAGTMVLELACGTGRVTLPLAAAGVEIVGLDIDGAALAVACERRGAAAWPLLLAADMRRFALHQRFGAVIVPYNSFQLLADPADATACLRASLEHLAPGGTFALEVTDFQAGATRDEVPEEVVGRGELDGEPITLSGSLTHDRRRRLSRYRRRFVTERWTVTDEVVLRSYQADELAETLGGAGLVVARCWREGPVTRVAATAG